MRNRNKLILSASLVLASVLLSSSANAGPILEQLTYGTDIAKAAKTVVSWVGLVLGAGLVIWAGVVFAKDYVFAKDDRERHFRPIQLFFACLVGFLMAYPSAGFILGGDLVGKNASGDVEASEFKRN